MQTICSAMLFTLIAALWLAIPVGLIAFAKVMLDTIRMEKELERIQKLEAV